MRSKFSLKFRDFLLGIPFVLVGGLMIGGQDFWAVLVLSVVCTFGAGLLIWVPLSYGVGVFVRRTLFPLVGLSSQWGGGSMIDVPKNTSVVEGYLLEGKKNGLSMDQMEENLLRVGWSKEDIEKAQRAVFDRLSV